MEPRIEIHPHICNGRPVIRGTRITVQTVLEFLGAGDSIEQLLDAYPGLTRKDILAALRRIEAAKAPFVSRGDKSGTHAAELRYWKAAGVDLDRAKGPWYRDTGSGMGPALNTAASLSGYILADRGTWLSFKNRADLAVLVQGDERLFNQYGVMLVNPARHPHVKVAAGRKFIEWVLSPAGQRAIADYKIGGEQLFFPNARPALAKAA